MSLKDSSTHLRLVEEDRAEIQMPKEVQHPALTALVVPRWDDVFGLLLHASESFLGSDRAQAMLDALGNGDKPSVIRDAIRDAVDALYAVGKPKAGEFALAWSLLTCSPRRPVSFRAVLPQLQYALDEAVLEPGDDAILSDRIRIWWRAAQGEFKDSTMSMFALAHAVLNDTYEPPEPTVEAVATWFASPYAGPTLTVMPKDRASKLNNHNRPFEAILDKALPLVRARNIDSARRRLGYEFPHAENALMTLFRDLREGQPVRFRPTILVGPAGAGKSRIVRRFCAEIGIQHVQRYDGAGSSDSQFGGTSKAWSNTEASVPARAVLFSKTANPVVMVDEIDKGAVSAHNGRLWDAMLPYLEQETAARHRDVSLDCELDLSAVGYLCTANDVTLLPETLRDRFRIVRVPAPRLVDLPLLAGSIVDMMLLEEGDDWAGSAAPFAPDELAVMAKAWERSGFSLRKLQKIVRATLEARDNHAMRH